MDGHSKAFQAAHRALAAGVTLQIFSLERNPWKEGMWEPSGCSSSRRRGV